jgi:hypothetical protein
MGAGMGLVLFASVSSAASAQTLLAQGSVAQQKLAKTEQVIDLEKKISEALKAGSFVPNSSKTEYNLKTNGPILERSADGRQLIVRDEASASTWSDQSVPVQFQVGTYLGKPAYIMLATWGKYQRPVNETLENLDIPPGLEVKDPSLRLCRGKRHCVKTCTDARAHEYCCKWDCIS